MGRHKSHQVPLEKLFYTGFRSGLCWKTQTLEVYDEKLKREVLKNRNLLHNPHAMHIAKVITRDLETTKKLDINKAFAKLYELAADKVKECRHFEPEEFFTHIEFKECYPIHHEDLLEAGDKINHETLEWIEGRVGWNEEIREKYWPAEITDSRSQGDGTDKLIINKEAIRSRFLESGVEIVERINESIRPMKHIPDEELFCWDTMRQDWPEWLHYRDALPEVEDEDDDEEKEEPRPAYEQIEVDTYDIIDTDNGDLPVAKRLKTMHME
ncbi:hypothetical protein F5Y02DRAFT_429498 [Annulohypoxylon stygium]|nr:hypothetical protein F5Y02DRAFT_429498 [Annulohypoxylon stygium]